MSGGVGTVVAQTILRSFSAYRVAVDYKRACALVVILGAVSGESCIGQCASKQLVKVGRLLLADGGIQGTGKSACGIRKFQIVVDNGLLPARAAAQGASILVNKELPGIGGRLVGRSRWYQ